MPIVTYAEASQFVANDNSLENDVNFKGVVDGANAFVAAYCGVDSFDRTERVSVVPASDVIVLPLPIAALTEVRSDPFREFGLTTIETDLTRYPFSNSASGSRITWLDYSWRTFRDTWLRIVWTGGYYPTSDPDPLHVPKMPGDLRLATLQIIGADWRGATSGEQFQSETLGEYSYSRAQKPQGFPYDAAIQAKLDLHAVFV